MSWHLIIVSQFSDFKQSQKGVATEDQYLTIRYLKVYTTNDSSQFVFAKFKFQIQNCRQSFKIELHLQIALKRLNKNCQMRRHLQKYSDQAQDSRYSGFQGEQQSDLSERRYKQDEQYSKSNSKHRREYLMEQSAYRQSEWEKSKCKQQKCLKEQEREQEERSQMRRNKKKSILPKYLQNYQQSQNYQKYSQQQDNLLFLKSLNYSYKAFQQKSRTAEQKISTFINLKHKAVQKNKKFNRNQYQPRISTLKSKNSFFVIDHSLIHSQKTITINGQTVYFPHQPYEVQKNYMQSVLSALQNKSNALLQSPTGTGKTLCLLSSVLNWVENNYKKNQQQTKVIYMSRTHSQLKQISNQLQQTCYRPTMTIVGSRQHLCINQQLSQLKGIEKNEQCSMRVRLKKQLVKRQIKGQEGSDMQEKTACHYFRQIQDMEKIANEYLTNTILDIETMKQIGEQIGFCPYFYPSFAKTIATLFVMPYNYLLDAAIFSNYKELIQDSVVIFDEAHNVAQAACQGMSFSFQSSHIQNAKVEINRVIYKNKKKPQKNKLEKVSQKQLDLVLRDLQNYQENFRKYGEDLFKHTKNQFKGQNQGKEENLTKFINKEKTELNIFQLFCGHVIPDQKKPDFQSRRKYYKTQMQRYLISPLGQLVEYGTNIVAETKEKKWNTICSYFEKFIAFARKIKQLLSQSIFKDQEYQWADIQINHFRLYITPDPKNIQNFTFGFRCLVPWLAFKNIESQKPRSIILTSGTLNPLQLWQKELKMKFTTQLSNNHVIKKEQIKCKIIKSGPSKAPFLFTFNNLNKKKDALYKDLLESILNICMKIPNGVLLAFPSFRLLNQFKNYLFNSPKRVKLLQYKHVMFQQKNVTNMQTFKQKAYSQKGVILGIVCRGKLSQGIDFPDELCRAVIMIGIPYPNIKDPIIIEKKNHLENLALTNKNKSKCLRGEQWYQMGTIRSLNQALGRVIRHVKDYGMIFLFDRRFQENKFKTQLPRWIKNSLQVLEQVDQNLGLEITRFYQEMKLKFSTKHQAQNQDISRVNSWDEDQSGNNQRKSFSSSRQNRHLSYKMKKEYDF